MKCCSITYLEVDCGKLQIYTINPKASTKIIKPKLVAKQPTKELKWNYNGTKFIQKKAEKEEMWENKEIVQIENLQMADVNLTILINTLNANTPIKRQR